MGLWVPPKVARELRDNTKQYEAELVSMLRFEGPVLSKWNKELRAIDPLLRLVQAREKAHAPGVLPGYYHLLRFNHGAPPWVQPITGPSGEFVEPTSRMLDNLRAADLQNSRAVQDRRRADEEAERARKKEARSAHEERVDEAVGRVKSLTETSVSLNTDTPWSQNVAGRKGVVHG